jgi:hypothetical protein
VAYAASDVCAALAFLLSPRMVNAPSPVTAFDNFASEDLIYDAQSVNDSAERTDHRVEGSELRRVRDSVAESFLKPILDGDTSGAPQDVSSSCVTLLDAITSGRVAVDVVLGLRSTDAQKILDALQAVCFSSSFPSDITDLPSSHKLALPSSGSILPLHPTDINGMLFISSSKLPPQATRFRPRSLFVAWTLVRCGTLLPPVVSQTSIAEPTAVKKWQSRS